MIFVHSLKVFPFHLTRSELWIVFDGHGGLFPPPHSPYLCGFCHGEGFDFDLEDSVGNAFTFPIFRTLGGCVVVAYVHYPVIRYFVWWR